MLFSRSIAAGTLVVRVVPYLFSQRDVYSTTVEESLKQCVELSTQTYDALRPACPTSWIDTQLANS
jgi:hypothetical protein